MEYDGLNKMGKKVLDSRFNLNNIVKGDVLQGGTVLQWVALSPHSKKVLGIVSQPGPFCVEFACSPRVYVSFLQVIRFPPPVQRHAG
uniref:Uncharacterized protein n=1 Tax=Anguilla anguilla TaxID=7936 RepID=A0A0E9X7W8_ANGAN